MQQNGIPVRQGVEIAEEAARELGLSVRCGSMFDVVARSVPFETVEGHSIISTSEWNGFLKNFESAVRMDNSAYLQAQRGLRVSNVVGIEEFVTSPYYMDQGNNVWPATMRELKRLYDPGSAYIEAVLTGAIGIGKNYFSDMVMSYELYKLSCYHDPQTEFGLAPGSSIVFIMQSKTATLAKKVIFGQFTERLKRSPYFQENFMYDEGVRSELRFPKNIYILPIGGSDTGALGMNVFGGMIDELNFMARVKDSVQVAFTNEDEYDQAERLYRVIIRRIKSRFMQKGKVPGKLLLVSSVNYPGDFTDRKMDEAKTEERTGAVPTIFVMRHAQWDVLPADRYSGERFLVEVGNELKQSRIIADMSEAIDEEDVITVPVEYRGDFERDIEASLRDYAGVATGTKSPFIPQRELIVKAQQDYADTYDDRTLFKLQSCALSRVLDPSSPDFESIVDMQYLDDCVMDPTTVFAAHIDVGLTNDAAGIAIGRISSYKMLSNVRIFNERTKDFIEVRDIRAPVYTIDGILQCVAPPNGEVDLELVRDLIYFLRSHIYIKWATMDSYQSAMLIQSFKKTGMKSGLLSVDTNPAPYAEVKQAIKDERLLMPPHVVAAKELRELERDPEKNKVDHPDGGSKDCADGIAGVIYILQRKEAHYGRGASTRREARKRRAVGRKQSTGRKVRHVQVGRGRKKRER